MTREEFAYFANLLRASFPSQKILPDKPAMELWFDMLQDIPYLNAAAFLKKWVSTEKWCPSIAEIRQGCSEILQEPVKDWGSAWEETMKAISRYGYMEEQRGLNSLEPMTRATVERMGWKFLCCSENQAADRANFRMIYENLEHRERQDRQIPEQLKETLQKLQLNGRSIDGKPLLQ